MFNPPSTITDLKVAVPCIACITRSRICGNECSVCHGTAWELKEPDRLTLNEHSKLQSILNHAKTS